MANEYRIGWSHLMRIGCERCSSSVSSLVFYPSHWNARRSQGRAAPRSRCLWDAVFPSSPMSDHPRFVGPVNATIFSRPIHPRNPDSSSVWPSRSHDIRFPRGSRRKRLVRRWLISNRIDLSSALWIYFGETLIFLGFLSLQVVNSSLWRDEKHRCSTPPLALLLAAHQPTDDVEGWNVIHPYIRQISGGVCVCACVRVRAWER